MRPDIDTYCMTKVQIDRRKTAPSNREVSSPHVTVRQRAMRGRPKDKRIDEDVVLAVLDTLKSKGYRHRPADGALLFRVLLSRARITRPIIFTGPQTKDEGTARARLQNQARSVLR
jgi:hypothetical protein